MDPYELELVKFKQQKQLMEVWLVVAFLILVQLHYVWLTGTLIVVTLVFVPVQLHTKEVSFVVLSVLFMQAQD